MTTKIRFDGAYPVVIQGYGPVEPDQEFEVEDDEFAASILLCGQFSKVEEAAPEPAPRARRSVEAAPELPTESPPAHESEA